MINNILHNTSGVISYSFQISPGFSLNVSVANIILDLDVVVLEDANTTGLLVVLNGDMYDDFTYPNGTNIRHSVQISQGQ